MSTATARAALSVGVKIEVRRELLSPFYCFCRLCNKKSGVDSNTPFLPYLVSRKNRAENISLFISKFDKIGQNKEKINITFVEKHCLILLAQKDFPHAMTTLFQHLGDQN